MCGHETEDNSELCAECSANESTTREVSRRRFLGWGAVAVGGVIGVGYLGAALRLLYPTNLSASSSKLQDIGPTNSFPVGQYILVSYTGDGYDDGVYVMNQGNSRFIALDFHCAHLQCPVQWFQALEKFICPCHGSQYNKYGQHIAGPAPRGLFPHVIKIANGRVLLGGQIA